MVPAGVGSVTLQVDDLGRASFGTMQYKGTPLTSITQLTFNSYSASGATLSSPTLQFEMDYNSTDSNTVYQGRLVSIPASAPTADTWVAHDALAGTWWATQAPGNTVCTQGTPCTWPQVIAAFPNAAIREDPIGEGALLFRLGGPITGGAVTSVDKFTINVGFPSTTFDFEPGATVNPSVAPPGSLVAIEAYGFRPLKNVRVFYYTNLSRNNRVKLCRAQSSITGAFYCAVNIPADAEAGPSGVHTMRIKGPRRIDYTTGFYLSP